MTPAELDAIAEAVGVVLRDAVAALRKEVDLKTPPPIDIEAIAERAAALIKPPKGEPGEKGDKGDPADPIDMVALSELVKREIEAIPLPQDGKDGAPGKDGVNGIDGRDGKDGEVGKDGKDGAPGEPGQSIQGPPGKDGEPGKPGERGADGKDGRDAKDGRDGRDGLDALAINPLIGIDSGRTYSAGQWASHNGGLFRYDGAQWVCMVDGLHHCEEARENRTVKVVRLYASGKTEEFTFKTSEIEYRQIWKQGEAYERGDVVTWGGSAWHCNRDTSDKPGSSDAWQLFVKEGRAGKDGKDGNEPPKPPDPPIRLK